MKPRVYIETSIPSYLTSRPSLNIIQAAHQQITRDWWDKRDEFELFISQLVIDECQAGDPQAAAARLAALSDIVILEQTQVATNLAQALCREVPLPSRAANDAVHIAIATVAGLDYFLTWNCRHIANLTLQAGINATSRKYGYVPPLIGTPHQLFNKESPDA